MKTEKYDFVVIGGGIFGCAAASHLAAAGRRVLMVEKDDQIMRRASHVNQARLHTGFHYPRSLMTARDSYNYFSKFSREFAPAVRSFKQIYAVSKYNSKTNSRDFRRFSNALDVGYNEINPNSWFVPGSVEAAFEVNEPTFDSGILRNLFQLKLEQHNVSIKMGTTVVSAEVNSDNLRIQLSDGSKIDTNKAVIASYASTNHVREIFSLEPLPLEYELTEVVLGTVEKDLRDVGFTVMDGPFWSLMPFGDTGLTSLTSVGLTPVKRATQNPVFDCQQQHKSCSHQNLFNCNNCEFKPQSLAHHQIQQMKRFLLRSDAFKANQSMFTIKTILKQTQVDDSRPTLIQKDLGERVITVFSGKVSTLFDLEKSLL